jgi:hypothetical protein
LYYDQNGWFYYKEGSVTDEKKDLLNGQGIDLVKISRLSIPQGVYLIQRNKLKQLYTMGYFIYALYLPYFPLYFVL